MTLKGTVLVPLNRKRLEKVVPGCLIEAGDIEKSNGMGGQSIYGPSLSSALCLQSADFLLVTSV